MSARCCRQLGTDVLFPWGRLWSPPRPATGPRTCGDCGGPRPALRWMRDNRHAAGRRFLGHGPAVGTPGPHLLLTEGPPPRGRAPQDFWVQAPATRRQRRRPGAHRAPLGSDRGHAPKARAGCPVARSTLAARGHPCCPCPRDSNQRTRLPWGPPCTHGQAQGGLATGPA